MDEFNKAVKTKMAQKRLKELATKHQKKTLMSKSRDTLKKIQEREQAIKELAKQQPNKKLSTIPESPIISPSTPSQSTPSQKNTEIKMSDVDAKRAEAEMNSVQQINYLLAQVDLLSELVELYLEQGALAEEKVIEEQIKFSEARGQKSLVLAAKINANQANMTYLQAAGTYQKIIIDYKAAIDQLYN